MCAHQIYPVYTILFQASLHQGRIPNDWKEAHIVPVYKKGDTTNAENYRPVSLTSVTCKLLEHIVHSNVMEHLTKNDALTDVQHGFRKNRSCESQLITTCNDFAENLNKGQQILDFSKISESVDSL